MYTLYLLQFNNYYNRQIKRCATLDDYKSYLIHNGALDANGAMFPNVHFNLNNYVNTTQVIDWAGDIGNYLLVTQPGDEGEVIHSRWFVINSQKTREGQHILTLHRDVVVDYYDQTIAAPCFIEKATPTSINDPAIFNSENMSFNQIKQSETLLKDQTKCAWVVGYIPRDSFDDENEEKRTISASFTLTENASESKPKTSFPFWSLSTNNGKQVARRGSDNPCISVRAKLAKDYNDGQTTWTYAVPYFSLYRNPTTMGYMTGTSSTPSLTWSWSDSKAPARKTGALDYDVDLGVLLSTISVLGINSQNIASWATTSSGVIMNNKSDIDALWAINGNLYREAGTNILYRAVVTPTPSTKYLSYDCPDGLWERIDAAVNFTPRPLEEAYYTNWIGTKVTYYEQLTGTVTQAGVKLVLQGYTNYSLTYEEVTESAVAVIPQPKDRNHLVNTPYDMFCLPYPVVGEDNILPWYVKWGTSNKAQVIPRAALAIAQSIGPQAGSQSLYDVQILPYCPLPSVTTAIEDVTVNGNTIQANVINMGGYSPIEVKNTQDITVSALAFSPVDAFEAELDYVYTEQASTILQKKVNSETKKYRIVSPSAGSFFDFNPQMLQLSAGGTCTFKVSCTYKPYNPFIYVRPNYSGLYGGDFNDNRGLIINEDMSLPQVTDAWADYQQQNKNYQQIFDRGTQDILINNAVQRTKEKWQIAAGTLQGYAQGSQYGSGKVLGLGGLLGLDKAYGAGFAGFSLAAGLADLKLNDQLRAEALDYRNDLYNYQLGNIQALPQGLAKTTAFAATNKYFPYIEVYDCSPTEQEALESKLAYNGYTIMRIGKIDQFILPNETYIKGQIIRPENIVASFNVITALSDEIYQGVFISSTYTPARSDT